MNNAPAFVGSPFDMVSTYHIARVTRTTHMDKPGTMVVTCSGEYIFFPDPVGEKMFNHLASITAGSRVWEGE